MKLAITILRLITLYLLLSVATILMLNTVLQYVSFKDNVGFLQYKQAYLHIGIWKLAFYTHVFSSILTLAAGFTQFMPSILQENKKLHRLIGRIYAWDILLINFPAGFIMAIYANGMLPSKIAFVVLDYLWAWFTLKAILAAKKGNIQLHKEFMIRSYALTLSAITLRTWKVVLGNTLVPDPELLYKIDAWLGFVPNILLAEWYIRNNRKNKFTGKKQSV
ncbi:DUF2306 domain-containing protein [Chitinophaga sp. Hz27]|uniref:DUF2306 domain-containing protein n=1 Tax=Chitinophaga sp. Hz27 TaxID=3347169 RepID=UPI0035DD55EA